ncbi:SDR family oxidoreductase [Aurantiacibacter spongiae]|uniref:NAD-dependent epimerase/dehydratase family protein n=1 Tax=Aurantiacibacter spongiae TaxID=2488860 RepID=A0A3N5DRR0_9SPHN|nr:SDR family oxidoreductase [Aurantiacibacter spongiae]RPF71881.1 NAD-dependent epimerase/dehydratase family protein [Aurantiacibacter spongiae]
MLTILVTGAAGLIGGEVCARLAKRGHRMIGMVRRTPDIRGNDGAPVNGVTVVAGDVRQPLMGLEPAAFDLVIHCAASLEFDAPQEELSAVNVEGTRNAMDFAKAAEAGFLHVSTAYVCGQRDGPIAEGPVPEGTRFTNRYEASKAAGERVIEEGGTAFAIARPSIVLGDSATGRIRQFPSLCNVFRLMARGKVTRFPAAGTASLDLVPIDHVAASIVALAERFDAAAGGHYHLVAADPLPAAELAHGVARAAHLPDPVVVRPADYDPAALSPAERLLAGRMLATFGPYFTRSPRFDDTRLREVTGLSCPATDNAWLDRLIAYGVERGYLPQPA